MDGVKIRTPYGNTRGKNHLSQGTYSWQRFLKPLQVFFCSRTVTALSVQAIENGGFVLFYWSGQANRTFEKREVWTQECLNQASKVFLPPLDSPAGSSKYLSLQEFSPLEFCCSLYKCMRNLSGAQCLTCSSYS